MPKDGNIFNRLLTLPLFQGMSRSDLQEAVAHTRIGFGHYDRGELVVKAGDRCTHQLFLVSGELEVTACSVAEGYTLTEVADGPYLLQPERLFGLTQCYSRSFAARTPCQLLTIAKGEMVRLSAKFDIFRINLLNILTTQVQRSQDAPWASPIKDIGDKITHFVQLRSITGPGEKTLRIRMSTLAAHIGESRLNVSRQLHRWEEEGVIEMSRNRIRWGPVPRGKME